MAVHIKSALSNPAHLMAAIIMKGSSHLVPFFNIPVAINLD
jgi:hypothetical protein